MAKAIRDWTSWKKGHPSFGASLIWFLRLPVGPGAASSPLSLETVPQRPGAKAGQGLLPQFIVEESLAPHPQWGVAGEVGMLESHLKVKQPLQHTVSHFTKEA